MGGSRRARDRAETAGTGRYEAWHAGIALLGPRVPPHARRRAAQDADVATLKGLVDALHAAAGRAATRLRGRDAGASSIRICTPGGRRGSWTPPARDYGSLGEVHPRVAEAWGLPGRPVIASINLGCAARRWCRTRCWCAPVPAAQPVDRDLAVSVDEATPLGELLRVAAHERRAAAGRGSAVRRLPRPAGRRGARVLRHRAPIPAGEGRRREERGAGA